ncbi:MAG: heme exporter protein CcmB [Nitratireductor sp.]
MTALFKRELISALRVGGGGLIGVVFFLCVIAIVPFAIGPDLKLLSQIGPAILWIGALLATLLGLERLFQQDKEDGSLDLLVSQAHPLFFVILIKCMAHWLVSCLPLVVATPLFALMLNVGPVGMFASMLTLLVGTPAITFIGAVGASITVTLARGGLLIAVLVLPLVIPVLIFGVMAIDGAINDPQPFTAPFLILCAFTLFTSVLGPLAASLMLRHSAE